MTGTKRKHGEDADAQVRAIEAEFAQEMEARMLACMA